MSQIKLVANIYYFLRQFLPLLLNSAVPLSLDSVVDGDDPDDPESDLVLLVTVRIIFPCNSGSEVSMVSVFALEEAEWDLRDSERAS